SSGVVRIGTRSPVSCTWPTPPGTCSPSSRSSSAISATTTATSRKAEVLRVPPAPKPLAERFWPKVKKTQGCWEWTGYRMPNGYGQIGRGGKGGGMAYAHRVSVELDTGKPIPEGFE